jgi:hypothetical protein
LQILGEAKNGLSIVEADRRVIAAHGKHVALLTGATEPLVKGAIAASDCDIGHVTG